MSSLDNLGKLQRNLQDSENRLFARAARNSNLLSRDREGAVERSNYASTSSACHRSQFPASFTVSVSGSAFDEPPTSTL
jgi:hypothetical protein